MSPSARSVLVFFLTLAPLAFAGDWPMLGGNPSRNLANSSTQRIPDQWDVASGKNIKWTAPLGSPTYSSPTIAKGKVLIGSNNEANYDPNIKGDQGNLLCFKESDGSFLWQAVHAKLASGPQNDWPKQGVASTPAVDGDRVYYVNNRCELVCLDLEGFADQENDGLQTETDKGAKAADLVWKYDMIKELAVFPHNLANASPLILGDLVVAMTSNAVDDSHSKLGSPDAPDFVAFNKKTGALAWKGKSSHGFIHGEWSSPAAGKINGKDQFFFGAGDGWLYGYGVDGKQLWSINTNIGDPANRNSIVATPVFHEGSIYLAGGDDPDSGSAPGNLLRVEPKGTGELDASSVKWTLGGEAFTRTTSSVAIHGGLVYAVTLDGFILCIDQATGKELWKHDLMSTVWSSPLAVDGKIYIGDTDGDICILGQGRTKKEIAELNLGAPIYANPVVANNTLYIATGSKLFAIATK